MYFLARTLVAIVGQRLVQTLCADSRRPIKVEGAIKEQLEKELKDAPPEVRKSLTNAHEVYEAMFSATCPKGTKGRLGVFEVLGMTKTLEDVILKDPSHTAVMAEFRRQGRMTMREDGILKVLGGRVGLEQLEQLAIT